MNNAIKDDLRPYRVAKMTLLQLMLLLSLLGLLVTFCLNWFLN